MSSYLKNIGEAAAARANVTQSYRKAIGAVDEAAWKAKYQAWKLNPTKGDFGPIDSDLNVGGLCREVAGMTPGGVMSSLRAEAAAAAGKAGVLNAIAEGAEKSSKTIIGTAASRVTRALSVASSSGSGSGSKEKKSVMGKLKSSFIGLKTATGKMVKDTGALLKDAAKTAEQATAALTGVQQSMTKIAEEVYDKYVGAATAERNIRMKLRDSEMSKEEKDELLKILEKVTDDVKHLRDEAKKASQAAIKAGSGPVGWYAFKRGGGGSRKVGLRSKRKTRKGGLNGSL